MKKNIFLPILNLFFIYFVFVGCGEKNNSTPSIKENSNHLTQKKETDYSKIKPKELINLIKAHYHLKEYNVAKDQIVYLINSSYYKKDSIILKKLKELIDLKLADIQLKKSKKEALARNKRLSTSLEKMKVIQDGKSTIYIDINSPEFETKECFYTYIKVTNTIPKLYFKVRYIDPNPLNIQDYIINVDKLDYTITGEVEKYLTKGKKIFNVELLNKEIRTNKDLTALNAIATADEVIALYVGQTTYRKRNISSFQKNAIKNVLDAYTYLKSKQKMTR